MKAINYKTIAILSLLVFVFLLGFSFSVQAYRISRQELNSPVSQYLRENYGVNSIEEYRAKLEQEAWLNISKQMEALATEYPEINFSQWRSPDVYRQYGTSTYQPPKITPQQPFYTAIFSEPVTALQIFSFSGLGLLGLVAVPPVRKSKRLKQALVLGAVVLCVFSVGYFVGLTTAQTWTTAIEPGSLVETASYVIWTDGTYVYAKNGRTGAIDFKGTDARTVINNALGALTPNRTWKEKVVLQGRFNLTGAIRVPSYTVLEGGDLFVVNGANDNAIENYDRTNGNTDIDIIGVHVDANWENQTGNTNAITMSRVTRVRVLNCVVRGGRRATNYDFYKGSGEGIMLAECTYGVVANNFCHDSYYDDIKVYKGSQILVCNNHCYGATQVSGGIQCSAGADMVVIVGNIVYKTGTGNRGIKNHACPGAIIACNRVYKADVGIDLIDASDRVLVANNLLYRCDTGIYKRDSSAALVMIHGNVIIGLNNTNGILVDAADHMVITGNLISGSDTIYPITNGIKLSSSSVTNTKIMYNFLETVTNPIVDNGVNTIKKYNSGYVTENSGTAVLSVPFATTGVERISVSYTFPTAFAVTPKVVLATTNTTDISLIGFTAVSTTSVTWVFSDNVGVDKTSTVGVTVYWYAEG